MPIIGDFGDLTDRLETALLAARRARHCARVGLATEGVFLDAVEEILGGGGVAARQRRLVRGVWGVVVEDRGQSAAAVVE